MLKPPELELHSTVWQRVHEFRSAVKSKGRWQTRWQKDKECPIRMRGYAELEFGNLDDKLRKKLDSALKRGYALENTTQLPHLLLMVEQFNPIQRLAIGYIGKTTFQVYVPTVDEAEDLRKELIATNTMTDSFKGNKIEVGSPRIGYYSVCMQWAERREDEFASKSKWNTAAHLKPCFTKLRPCIDSWLDNDAAVREEIARWCANDNAVIRLPFDSHRNWRKP